MWDYTGCAQRDGYKVWPPLPGETPIGDENHIESMTDEKQTAKQPTEVTPEEAPATIRPTEVTPEEQPAQPEKVLSNICPECGAISFVEIELCDLCAKKPARMRKKKKSEAKVVVRTAKQKKQKKPLKPPEKTVTMSFDEFEEAKRRLVRLKHDWMLILFEEPPQPKKVKHFRNKIDALDADVFANIKHALNFDYRKFL